MAKKRSSRFHRRFVWLCLLVGLAPLVLQTALWLEGSPSWAALRTGLVATGVGAAILVVLVLVLPGRLAAAVDRALTELRAVLALVSEENLRARSRVVGPGRELRRLGATLNGLIDTHKGQVLNRQLEVEQSNELRTASRRLIEECIYAREPLVKQQPWLASAYAAAAIRHSGKAATENQTVDALVHGVDAARTHKANRENQRWALDNITVEVPVPSKLLNMSVTGMAVESNRGLPVGGSWVFRVGNGALAYDIPGKVRWCRLDRTVKVAEEIRPIYRTGVAFDRRLAGRAFDFFSPAAPAGSHSSATG